MRGPMGFAGKSRARAGLGLVVLAVDVIRVSILVEPRSLFLAIPFFNFLFFSSTPSSVLPNGRITDLLTC
jgi:hypothetical protein